jgi:hypothetical protein
VAGARAASTSPRPAECSTIRPPATCTRPTCYPRPDGWRTGLFDPANLDATLDALIAASQDASGAAEPLRKVERTLADCRCKLVASQVGWKRRTGVGSRQS